MHVVESAEYALVSDLDCDCKAQRMLTETTMV